MRWFEASLRRATPKGHETFIFRTAPHQGSLLHQVLLAFRTHFGTHRIIFEKLVQVLRFGCSYASIADGACSATTIRDRRDEWIAAGIFAQLKQIAVEAYDRIAGLVLQEILIDGCITKAPGGGECAGRSPVDRGKQGMKRSLMTDGHGIPLDRVLAPAQPARLPAAGTHAGQAR